MTPCPLMTGAASGARMAFRRFDVRVRYYSADYTLDLDDEEIDGRRCDELQKLGQDNL